MKSKKLSKEMIKCLEHIQSAGSLFRSNHGLWTGPDTPMITYGMDLVPEWYYGKGTIDALIKRGLLIVWNSRPGKYGVYPYEVKIAPDYKEKIKLYNYEK